MTIGSLFSGIGGLELGLEMCGLGPVLWQAECDPHALAVLAEYWPNARRYTDVKEIDERAARVDVLCGGFPCQDVSSAGKRAGLSGARSGLWWEFRRVVRVCRPRLVFIENVNSGRRAWLPIVRRTLWRVGYASVPIRVSASDVGAPHERARVFVLAYADRNAGRLQQGRVGGSGRGDPAIAEYHGAEWSVAHSDGGWELQSGRRVIAERGCPGDCSGRWPAEPDVGRVAHGVPARVDRLRLLGNAVVPQQAALAWRTLRARL